MNEPSRQRQRARHARRVALRRAQPPQQSRRRFIWATVTSTALATVVTVFATGFTTAIASRVSDIFADQPVPHVTSTDVRYLRMFDEAGRPSPGFTVSSRTRTRGNCWESSIVSSDPGAYRCAGGTNELFDPCWQAWGRSGNYVGCLETPWSHDIVMLRLASEIDVAKPDANLQAEPWGLEVQDPRDPRAFLRCTFQGGVTSPIGGQVAPWRCVDEHGKSAGGIIGRPDKSGKGSWKVYFAADGSNQIVRTSVRTAWK